MKVFVLGGTQFMGRLTVEALLAGGHEVVLFNRGRTTNPFASHAKLRHVKCDRMGEREGFREALRKQGKCDAVIDFIGFQEAYVQDTIDALTLDADPAYPGGRRFSTRHYVFVSTDSVYWAQKVPCADARLAEGDVRDFSPAEFDEHQEYCHKTSLGEYQLRYGGNKLGCERLLEEAWREDGFPYTVLRLPDVYGPYDNLGGLWDLVTAIEAQRPIPSRLVESRLRSALPVQLARPRRFSWAFVEDVRDAIVACTERGAQVHGMTMNVAHEEAVSLVETCKMIAEALGMDPETALRFDDSRDASLPSTDFGVLDVSRALELLRPWRPTAMRHAVQRSVEWFVSCKEHRRYHRLVHREPRSYDEVATRKFSCRVREVPSCWVGSPEKVGLLLSGPAVLNDSLPSFTGQAVLGFMQRLMDQAGQEEVVGHVQRGVDLEEQRWPLRHFAGHLLTQSDHSAAYRLEDAEVLGRTDLAAELASPLADVRPEAPPGCDGLPLRRTLRLGGAGARPALRRCSLSAPGLEGFWDCALLGRRRWRLFPPSTLPAELCVPGGGSSASSAESPADCFAGGPDAWAVQLQHTGFAPQECWECEQMMGDAVVVPAGWWYQTYDDDRTLSISAPYGSLLPGLSVDGGRDEVLEASAPLPDVPGHRTVEEEETEVLEWEMCD